MKVKLWIPVYAFFYMLNTIIRNDKNRAGEIAEFILLAPSRYYKWVIYHFIVSGILPVFIVCELYKFYNP